jgi:hypothetical protein
MLPFFIVTIVVLAVAFAVSLRLRWVGPRRTVMLRCIAIWAVAAIGVVLAGNWMIGSVPGLLFVLGPSLVGLSAWAASSAR